MSKALPAFALVLLAATPVARAADILFVADSDGDLEIVSALRADGHTVEQVVRDYLDGTNTRLAGDLRTYDAVYWSADGTGAGGEHTDPEVFANLTEYVQAGGRVFVTGYDSVASPPQPLLWEFLGATGGRDTPGVPGSIADVETTLTVGVEDIRRIRPASVGDMDCLTGLTEDTIAIVTSFGDETCVMWSLRSLGYGEIAYITSGGGGPYWRSDTSPYAAAVRNFASATDASTREDGAPDIAFEGPFTASEGETIAIHASVTDPEGDTFTFSWDLDGNGTFGERAGEATYTVPAGTTDGPGDFRIGMQARDSAGRTATRYRTVRIANIAPRVLSEAPRVASVDTDLSYTLEIDEPAGDRDPLTYRIVRGPSRMSVGTDGVVRWTPTRLDLTAEGETVSAEVAIDDGDMGTTMHAWEMVVSLDRLPTPPVPAYPISMIGILDRMPRLAATNSQDLDLDPLSYHFELDTVPTFDSENVRASGSIAETPGFTAWQLEEPLVADTLYYWRVWSNDGQFDSQKRTASFWVVQDPALEPDAGPIDAGVVEEPDAGMMTTGGGCGCSAVGGRSSIAPLLLLAFFLLRRRR